MGVAINADGQFIVGDNEDETVKVFDSSGHFILKIFVIQDGERKLVDIDDVSTDEEGNIYALVRRKKTGNVYLCSGERVRHMCWSTTALVTSCESLL